MDITHTTVRLEFIFLIQDNGLAHQDQAALEVDVLPLEPMRFSGTHAGEEPDVEVIAVVHPHRVQDQFNLVKGERLHIAAFHLERFDIPESGIKLKPVGGFVEDLAQRFHHRIDASVGQCSLAFTGGNFGE